MKHYVRDIISCGIVMDESDLIMHAHHLCLFLSNVCASVLCHVCLLVKCACLR